MGDAPRARVPLALEATPTGSGMSIEIRRGLIAAGLLVLAGAAGAVEFQRQPTLLAQAPPQGLLDRYGTTVAAEGDTVAIAVGKQPGFLRYLGQVEVWARRDGSWRRQATIEGSGRFGHALVLHGDLLLIGAPGEPGLPGAGQVEIHRRIGERWVLEDRVAAAGRADGDAFGHAVALQDGRVLVGAPGTDGPQGDNQGAMHVFESTGPVWRETARLQDPWAQAGDLLGASVAWSGDLALGGAVGLDVQGRGGQGAVLGFTRGGAGWNPAFTLTADDGETGDTLGIAMAADAQRLVVGAHLDDVDGRGDAGSARVFLREGGRFVPEATLTAADGARALGYSVSLSGEAIALGGSAAAPTLFRRIGDAWQRTDSPEAASDDAALTVSLSGDTLAYGAPHTDVGTGEDRGVAAIAAYAEGWTTQALISSDDTPEFNGTFGWDLAIDDGHALIGAPGLCGGFCPPTVNIGVGHFFERAPNGAMEPAGTVIGRPVRFADGYAHAVSLRGDRAIVARGGGYDWEDQPGVDVFERDVAGVWRRAAQLLDAGGQPFAASDVAIDGDIAAAGNRFDLHLFHRDADGTWRHEANFPAGLRGAYVMSALALDGNTLALGISSWSGEAQYQGIVYLLSRRDGRWQLDGRLLGDSLPHVGFGDQVALHGDHLLVGESGAFESRPPGGVLAYERTAAGWVSRGRLALPSGQRWHAGIAVRGDLAFAYAPGGGEAGAVHAFEFRGGAWRPAGRQPASGPRIAFDGETLLVSKFGLNLNTALEVEVFSIRR